MVKKIKTIIYFLSTNASFFLRYSINPTHRISCNAEDSGVASPIWNSDGSGRRLIKYDTGTLTQNAPRIPWIMTKRVLPIPL